MNRMRPFGSIVFKVVMIALLFFVILLLTKPVGGAESWQAVWEKTVKAAKREGQLNVYSARNQDEIVSAGVFQKRYPEIKIVQVVVTGSISIQRILSERRAHKYIAERIQIPMGPFKSQMEGEDCNL